jgi:hypothetical protein
LPRGKWDREEYHKYLERYKLFGNGRPKLTAVQFDKLDDEVLDLLSLDEDKIAEEEQERLAELEFLLLLDEDDQPAPKRAPRPIMGAGSSEEDAT